MKTKAAIGFGLVMLATVPGQLAAAPAQQINNRTLVVAGVAQGRNAISGTVFGESNRPVADVYVELTDDFNSTVNRAKTDASGRFSFGGLISGRYRVRVLPYGTGYLEQIQDVTLTSVSAVSGSGSDRQNIDIYLRVDERANAGPFTVASGVVFAQEVPEPARKLYQEGLRYLREKKEQEGFESLKKSLEAFPDYYLALDRLGAEYATRGAKDRSYYEAGLVLLTKAVEVNPRGPSSVFGLGWTQYQLGLNREAIETLTRLTTLAGKSADAYLWLGKALKRASSLDRAEEVFKKADELAKGKVADIHWQLAGLYSDQKRYAEAADQFELFLKEQPKAADAERIKALIKQLRGKAAAK
jgi:Flp pilus assembly protein TadD